MEQKKVLIIEDEWRIQRNILGLTVENLSIDCPYDFEHVKKKLSDESYDAVLIDSWLFDAGYLFSEEMEHEAKKAFPPNRFGNWGCSLRDADGRKPGPRKENGELIYYVGAINSDEICSAIRHGKYGPRNQNTWLCPFTYGIERFDMDNPSNFGRLKDVIEYLKKDLERLVVVLNTKKQDYDSVKKLLKKGKVKIGKKFEKYAWECEVLGNNRL